MKDRRGSGGGNGGMSGDNDGRPVSHIGGRPVSGCTTPDLTLRRWICGSFSDKSPASTRDGLLEDPSA
jgi:hypothetical protein